MHAVFHNGFKYMMKTNTMSKYGLPIYLDVGRKDSKINKVAG